MSDSTAEFKYLPEHDEILSKIASTDEVESDWDTLRSMIKSKIQQNIEMFLKTTQKPPPPAPYLPSTTANGGLKLPPFVPRKLGQLHVSDPPVAYMNDEQAERMKKNIFTQLDEFEGSPPFTIQRICELCIEPKKHYKSVGKYLRAVEKATLVTSTIENFPPLTESEVLSAGRSAIMLGPTLQSAPSTPLFSPIPFLHDDARRSKSRSPPPTPLVLNPVVLPLDDEEHDDPMHMELPALGLVDELDDPGPGHLSEHPTALSSTTTVPDTVAPASSIHVSKPLFESLDQRFVKAEEAMDVSAVAESASSAPQTESDAMELDEDKENTKA